MVRMGGYSQHSGTSRQVEKIGRGHIPNSHVCSSKELGLPKEKKVGTGVDLNITVILGFIPCPFSYPCNRNLLSACSLQDTVLGRRGLKMITAQSLPQGIRCTLMPEGLSLANAVPLWWWELYLPKAYPCTKQTSRESAKSWLWLAGHSKKLMAVVPRQQGMPYVIWHLPC